MTKNKYTSPIDTPLNFPDPPRGIKAIPWRLPILLYRLGIGSILGKRFLLLNHTGRNTGQLRQAVLEIIRSYPSEDRYLVASGFGKKSQWYQNIIKQPRVTIQVGNKSLPMIAKQLNPSSAAQVMVDYGAKNPGAIKALSRLMGYEIEHTPDGYKSFGEKIPLIQFSPRNTGV